MPLTKATVVVHDDITLTAAAADTVSTTQDLTASYQTIARIRFTNGATGPTVQAQTKVQISGVDVVANYMTLATLVGGTANSLVSEYVIDIPAPALYLRFVSGSNTGQNVTLRVVIEKITGV